jgi:hypothetical protein
MNANTTKGDCYERTAFSSSLLWDASGSYASRPSPLNLDVPSSLLVRADEVIE